MRIIRKSIACILAALLIAASFSACGTGTPGTGKSVVNIGVTDTLSAANPLLLDQSELSKVVVDLQYQQLCELTAGLEFVGILADSITTEDNIHFKVHINDNAAWSDGEPVTADDVIFTVLKFASPVVANATMLLYAFEGTDDETGFTAEGATAEDLTGVTKIDEKTVMFTAKYQMPLATFENSYGRYLHILPEHVLSGYTDEELLTTDYFVNPEVISGPYRLTAYDTDHYITFEKNEKYWAGDVNIDALNIVILEASQIYAALASGEIDLVQQTTASVPYDDYRNIGDLENVRVKMGSPVTNQSLFIQTKNITDVRIRQAILCGIDRQTLVSGYLNGQGEVVDGFLSSASPFYDSALVPVPYDRDLAASLVRDAAEDGYDTSEPIDFYTNAGDATMTNAAAYIASGLNEIGLNVQVHTVDFSKLMTIAGTEEVDMFAVQYSYCPVDPYPDVVWLLGGEDSWTGYYSDEVQEALDDSQGTDDIERTREDYLVVDQAVQRDVPMVSLYIISALGAVNTRLQNAVPDVFGTFINVNEWTLAE